MDAEITAAINEDNADALARLMDDENLNQDFMFADTSLPVHAFPLRTKPLRAAVWAKAFKCMRWLIDHGADTNGNGTYLQCASLLADAAMRNSYQAVAMLLDAPNTWPVLSTSDWRNLYVFGSGGKPWVMANYLLHKGVRPLDPGSKGLPPDVRIAYSLIQRRIDNCRAACVALFRCLRPIRQRDVRILLVRDFVWNTKRNPVWTPDVAMIPGFY